MGEMLSFVRWGAQSPHEPPQAQRLAALQMLLSPLHRVLIFLPAMWLYEERLRAPDYDCIFLQLSFPSFPTFTYNVSMEVVADLFVFYS